MLSTKTELMSDLKSSPITSEQNNRTIIQKSEYSKISSYEEIYKVTIYFRTAIPIHFNRWRYSLLEALYFKKYLFAIIDSVHKTIYIIKTR